MKPININSETLQVFEEDGALCVGVHGPRTLYLLLALTVADAFLRRDDEESAKNILGDFLDMDEGQRATVINLVYAAYRVGNSDDGVCELLDKVVGTVAEN